MTNLEKMKCTPKPYKLKCEPFEDISDLEAYEKAGDSAKVNYPYYSEKRHILYTLDLLTIEYYSVDQFLAEDDYEAKDLVWFYLVGEFRKQRLCYENTSIEYIYYFYIKFLNGLTSNADDGRVFMPVDEETFTDEIIDFCHACHIEAPRNEWTKAQFNWYLNTYFAEDDELTIYDLTESELSVVFRAFVSFCKDHDWTWPTRDQLAFVFELD